jgi:hypothetical protein
VTYPEYVLAFSGFGLFVLGVIALLYDREHKGGRRERLGGWGIGGADSVGGLVIAGAITAIANLLPLWAIGCLLLIAGGGLMLLGVAVR